MTSVDCSRTAATLFGLAIVALSQFRFQKRTLAWSLLTFCFSNRALVARPHIYIPEKELSRGACSHLVVKARFRVKRPHV